MSNRADLEEVEVSLCPAGDLPAGLQGYIHGRVDVDEEQGSGGANRQPADEEEGIGTDRWRSFGLDASMSSVQALAQTDGGAGLVEGHARGRGGDVGAAESAGENCGGETRSSDDGRPQCLRLASGGDILEVTATSDQSSSSSPRQHTAQHARKSLEHETHPHTHLLPPRG